MAKDLKPRNNGQGDGPSIAPRSDSTPPPSNPPNPPKNPPTGPKNGTPNGGGQQPTGGQQAPNGPTNSGSGDLNSEPSQYAQDTANSIKNLMDGQDGSSFVADQLENTYKAGANKIKEGVKDGIDAAKVAAGDMKTAAKRLKDKMGEKSSDSGDEADETDDVEGGDDVETTESSDDASNSVASDHGADGVSIDTGDDADDGDDGDSPTVMERAKNFAMSSIKGTGIAKAMTAGASAVAAATGFTAAASTAIVATAAIATVATVAGGIVAAVSSAAQPAMDEMVVKVEDCDDEEAAAEEAVATDAAEGFANAAQEENVKKIYSVLKEYGFKDTEVAGAVGNMQKESNLNPRTIEALFNASDADYKKANENGATAEALFGSWGGFTAAYNNSGLSVSGYFVPETGKYWIGIGLIQWTGVTNHGFWKWAKANKVDMWSLETQLTALLTPDAGPYADRIKNFVTKDNSSPSKAALNFLNFVEYGGGSFTPNDGTWAKAEHRIQYAESWYVKIKEMQVDKTYAQSVLDKVKSSIQAASSDKVESTSDAAEDCNDKKSSANGSGWGKGKGGTYKTAGAWKPEDLPDDLKPYAIDPKSLGMEYGKSTGWEVGASNLMALGICNQCTTLSGAILGALWEKDGKPLGSVTTGNGADVAGNLASSMGVPLRKEPIAGDVFSVGDGVAEGHTGIVSHVFENGDMLVIEQNIKGLSGASRRHKYDTLGVDEFEWNYRIITSSEIKNKGYVFTSPEAKGYKPNPKAKYVG